MKKFLLILFIALLLIANIGYADNVNVNGKWAGTIALIYDVTVSMKQDDAKVNGLVNSEIGDIPLKDGVVNGNDVTFKPFTYNGMAVKYVKGKIDGDKMNVTIGFQSTSFTGVLKRVK